MSDWKKFRFGDLCDITRGASPRPIHDYLGTEGMPWIKIADATKASSRFIESTNERIKTKGVEASVRVYPGDLILSNSATPGMPKFVSIDACIHDGWMLLRNFRNLDKNFAYWLLTVERSNLVAQGNGSVFTNLKTEILKSHTVRIPNTIDEQKRIAGVLDSIENKIDINRKINLIIESIAQSYFKDWFIDFGPTRAKMAGQAPYLAPGIWALFPDRLDGSGLPDAWRASTLDQIADFLNGLALQKFPPSDNHWLPIIKIAQLRVNHCRNADLASANIPEQYVVEDGDILFSWSGSLMQCVWTGGRGALNQHLFKVTSSGYPKWFFYLWIEHHMPHFQSIAASKATTMGHIQRHHLTQAQVTIPGDDVLQAANALIAPLFEKIVSNSIEIKMLEHTRDMLLPKLMSGEFRINNAESIVRKTL